MIKFASVQGNIPLLGFGLSKGNIERLKQGQPISIDLSEMELGDTAQLGRARVLIFYGETEADMAREIGPFIGPDTKIIGQQPGEEQSGQ